MFGRDFPFLSRLHLKNRGQCGWVSVALFYPSFSHPQMPNVVFFFFCFCVSALEFPPFWLAVTAQAVLCTAAAAADAISSKLSHSSELFLGDFCLFQFFSFSALLEKPKKMIAEEKAKFKSLFLW